MISVESMMRLTTSESNISRDQLNQQASYSLLPAINNVPGVRMEERSPGSYRLSMRGSLLRSPFGIRNVKIYLGDFSFTDAGGNTYLNSLDIGNIGSVRLLKGPESSIFGANTGGVILINPILKTSDSLRIAASISGGSYGLLYENVAFQKTSKNISYYFTQGFQHAAGYRENSAIRKLYLQTGANWEYSKKTELKLLLLYSNLHYETPGGLTLEQYNSNPRQARPPTLFMPGATEQKAGVYNQTVFGGISHDIYITPNIKNTTSIFGSVTHFENPFITNYEVRDEFSIGGRTFFDFTLRKSNKFTAKWNLGTEWQQTSSDIRNYGNQQGVKDTMQANDKIKAQQGFVFIKFLADIHQKTLLEASASYNFFNYRYMNVFPYGEIQFNQKHFTPQFMPRIAVSYKLTKHASFRASASTGYSAPTIAEVRSSNNLVNTNLEAETGQNLEAGLRLRDSKDYVWIDVSAYYYKITNAIVRRVDVNGNEFFINAGGTSQPGIEAQLSAWLIKPRKTGFIRSLQVRGNVTYNHFTFSDYQVDSADYSGNKLTGVPDFTSAESIAISFAPSVNLYVQYYYSDGIPLNDANTVYAKDYHLLQMKMEWKKILKPCMLGFFGGIDNILNQKYSLGNDLNAMGGRYYNAAPTRNFYIGVKAEF